MAIFSDVLWDGGDCPPGSTVEPRLSKIPNLDYLNPRLSEHSSCLFY